MAERHTVEVVDDSEPSPGQSMFLCPSCEEIADQQTICCETCDSWFHYNCVGIAVNDVEKSVMRSHLYVIIALRIPSILRKTIEGY